MVSELLTDIVGWAIAVASVVGTLLWNARSDRRKREDDLERERQAVRAAVRAELAVIKRLCDAENSSSLFPRDAYVALTGRLGIISEDESGSVIQAYSEVCRWNASFPSEKMKMAAGPPRIPDELKQAVNGALESLRPGPVVRRR